MKRTAIIRIIPFFLLAVCGALCQERPSAHPPPLSRLGRPNSPGQQRQEMRRWNSLPDAPSPVQPQPDEFPAFFKEASSPLTLGEVAGSASVKRDVTSEPQTSLAALYQSLPVPRESSASAFFGKYLYPLWLKPDLSHYPSASGSFMGRISYTASRIFITCDDAGKRKPNPSYLLRALTSVAIHAAYRPYWAQSATATFNDFGSTIGRYMGVNVLHEFGPGIRQIVKGRTSKYSPKVFSIPSR